jgi:hypothetical protein
MISDLIREKLLQTLREAEDSRAKVLMIRGAVKARQVETLREAEDNLA